MAPEVILSKKYGPEVDSFSLGIALFELFTDNMPFTGSRNVIKSQILNSDLTIDPIQYPVWYTVDPEAKDLIMRLTHKEPRRRMSVSAALRHPWFSEFNEVESF